MKTSTLSPPVAARKPKSVSLHGETLQDDYAWLREKSSPETLAYLEAENAYTAEAMRDTEPMQATLYEEILSHIQEDDQSVPYRDGAWEYFTRTRRGLQYPIHFRKPVGAPLDDAGVLLDVNALAEGQPFMVIGSTAVSPDGNLLAYTTDNTGFRQYTLRIRDLRTGEDRPEAHPRVGSLVWAADSEHLFFTTEDEQTKRDDKAWRWKLESAPELICEESDERFNLGLGRTRDRAYVLMVSGSHTTSETSFLSAASPSGAFTLIAPRIDDEEYDVDHRDGSFYLRSNHGAEQFRLMRAPVGAVDRDAWQEILPEVADAPLEDFDLFQTFLVASYRNAGLPVLRVFDIDEQGIPVQPREIDFPDPAYETYTDINRDFRATKLRYAYQSLVRPASVFEYDVARGESTLLKQQAVPGNFDANLYGSERLWFAAEDGTKVPVSIVYRRDIFHRDGSAPLYLYGYGSYGYSLPLGFSAARLPLLDRGIVMAYAHIRGGGELGDPWHDAGKMMQKKNTFTDFIAAAEFLTAQGYASRERIAIEGGSAGGLLMGAVVNLRPELFRVVLSHVPFVDVMNTMLDASLPLTVGEYEEWGDPNEPEAFAYMRSYSPYDNLAAAAYPSMLIKTSLNDSQVMYWEPAKYTAKLRTLKTNADTPLLLHINMDAGHGGASGRYDYLKEIAFDHAFLLQELGVTS